MTSANSLADLVEQLRFQSGREWLNVSFEIRPHQLRQTLRLMDLFVFAVSVATALPRLSNVP